MPESASVMPLFPEVEPRHDTGCKNSVRIPNHWSVEIVEFGGPNECYRFKLGFRWRPGPLLLWLMKNPSKASHLVLDNTVAKCGRITERWGYSGFMVGNAVPYRHVNPAELLKASVPITTPRNLEAVEEMAHVAARIIAAHGTLHNSIQYCAGQMVAHIRSLGYPLYVLKLSKLGQPSHPLFLAEDTEPLIWR